LLPVARAQGYAHARADRQRARQDEEPAGHARARRSERDPRQGCRPGSQGRVRRGLQAEDGLSVTPNPYLEQLIEDRAMELKVYAQDGNDAGRTVTLQDAVVGIKPNDHAIWLDVRRIQAN